MSKKPVTILRVARQLLELYQSYKIYSAFKNQASAKNANLLESFFEEHECCADPSGRSLLVSNKVYQLISGARIGSIRRSQVSVEKKNFLGKPHMVKVDCYEVLLTFSEDQISLNPIHLHYFDEYKEFSPGELVCFTGDITAVVDSENHVKFSELRPFSVDIIKASDVINGVLARMAEEEDEDEEE